MLINRHELHKMIREAIIFEAAEDASTGPAPAGCKITIDGIEWTKDEDGWLSKQQKMKLTSDTHPGDEKLVYKIKIHTDNSIETLDLSNTWTALQKAPGPDGWANQQINTKPFPNFDDLEEHCREMKRMVQLAKKSDTDTEPPCGERASSKWGKYCGKSEKHTDVYKMWKQLGPALDDYDDSFGSFVKFYNNIRQEQGANDVAMGGMTISGVEVVTGKHLSPRSMLKIMQASGDSLGVGIAH